MGAVRALITRGRGYADLRVRRNSAMFGGVRNLRSQPGPAATMDVVSSLGDRIAFSTKGS